MAVERTKPHVFKVLATFDSEHMYMNFLNKCINVIITYAGVADPPKLDDSHL